MYLLIRGRKPRLYLVYKKCQISMNKPSIKSLPKRTTETVKRYQQVDMPKDEGCSSSPATGGSSLPPFDEKKEEESLNIWYAEEGASIGWVEPLTYCDHLGSLCSDLVHIPTSETPCSRCDNTAENWLCLSCKDVLCSRFVNKHMLEHYEQKGHCLALSYSDLSVWCFNCEAYLDAAVIQQLRPVYETAYILKFGEAPPVRIGAYFQLE